jgi:Flp pilus assembly protein TadD
MAWAYLTTPVAKKPDESGAWLNLGNNLAGQDAAVLAVKAYDAAFRAETTNPEPLFRMGQQLEQLERFDRAREVYARAATGDWHWRFDTWKNQARQRLEQLPANPDKLPD